MDLAHCLSAIYSVADLPRLVSELGHEPLWELAPPELGSQRPAVSGLHIVGQTGSVPWLAFECPNPERAACAIAGHLSVR
jgi:hypothetical protein